MTAQPLQSDDFDSPWKNILEWYFEEFVEFFMTEAYADIDWRQPVEFLDKELQQVVRDAEFGRRHVDKLAKVWRKSGQEQWVLVHIEVQGQYEAGFEERMYTYNYRLYDRYQHKVASFAVLSDDRTAWMPGQFGYELWGCRVHFEFPTAKLASYAEQWEMLEASRNPFAVVVMAHLKTQETQHDSQERRFWKFYLIRHLYERGYQRQDILNLFHFIDWLMYLPPNLEQQLRQEVYEMEAQKLKPYITSFERMAMEEGREEGRRLEASRLLQRILTHRFGELSKEMQAQLAQLTILQIETIVDMALTQSSFHEIVAYFDNLSAPSDEHLTEKSE
ncbi:MAG: DUF4351 domain-containing protein [Caldilineaceae bacterium]|nr:DUF4351 domain-containing protein [Caldilineaceae bacterium]